MKPLFRESEILFTPLQVVFFAKAKASLRHKTSHRLWKKSSNWLRGKAGVSVRNGDVPLTLKNTA